LKSAYSKPVSRRRRNRETHTRSVVGSGVYDSGVLFLSLGLWAAIWEAVGWFASAVLG
jgi:hypothetical protein